MTCPAKLVSGELDDSDTGMLSDEVIDKGYRLLCCARPQSDCTIQLVEEEELLNEQVRKPYTVYENRFGFYESCRTYGAHQRDVSPCLYREQIVGHD